MCSSGDDESTWLERLDLHINSNINPLLSSSISCEDVIQAIPPLSPPWELAELELVTIRHLSSRISNSFAVGVLHDDGHGDQDTSISPLSEGNLPQSPVFLLAVLKSSSSTGSRGLVYEGLVLADRTGEMPCQVSLSCLPVEGVGNLMLVIPTQWNLIFSELNKSPTYLELQEVILLNCHGNEISEQLERNIPFSVTSFKDYIQSCKDHSEPVSPFVDIVGRISAVSDVIKNHGKELLFLVSLAADDCDTDLNTIIFIKVSSLLHFSSLLRISERYLFTALEIKVIHKDSKSEMKVLSSTKATLIFPCSLSLFSSPLPSSHGHLDLSPSPSPSFLSLSPSPPPPPKKIKLSQHQSVVGGATSLFHSHRHTHQELISYQGTISKCLYPAAGVYELDGRVRLYLTHSTCSSLGRGLRSGVKVQLSNVYVLRVATDNLKHISGFFCCSLSDLRVIEFSPNNSPYIPFFSRNKLISLVKGYGMMDTVWLLEIFISLANRDLQQNTRHCFCCLKELCNMNIFHESHTLPPSHPIKMDALTSFRGDPITEFTTGLSKAYLQEERDLAPYPCLPSIAQFKETVMKRISQKSFKWYTGNGGLEGGQSSDTSINVAYVIRTEWMYGLLRASEYEHKQILIGDLLHESTNSGRLVLRERTGTLLVIPIMPKSCDQAKNGCSDRTDLSEILVSQLNKKLILYDFWVVIEKTITHETSEKTSSDLLMYLHPIAFKTVPLPPQKPSNEGKCRFPDNSFNPSQSFLIRGSSDNHIKNYYFRVLNKNMARINAVQKHEFTCQVHIHTELDSLYAAVLPGSSTESTSGSRLGKDSLYAALLPRRSTESTAGSRLGKDSLYTAVLPRSSSETTPGSRLGRDRLKIAIIFGGNCFKWFYLLKNNCIYSLSLKSGLSDLALPAWCVLERNLSLTVTEDMVVEFIGVCGGGGCVQDVGDMMKQLLLPPFKTDESAPFKRECIEALTTVSLRGVITSRSYRIDHMTLARGTLPNLPTSHTTTTSTTTSITATTSPCRIIALAVQSLESPDTINIYCEYRHSIPLPVGLVPGAVVTLHTFKLATSKSGNSYCKNTALSSIDINNILDTNKTVLGLARINLSMAGLSVSYLRELSFLLVRGLLSKSIVCVRVSYLTVLWFSFSCKCSCCQVMIANGKCMPACLRQRPDYQVSARFLIEDGSGSAHAYVSGDLVQKTLRVSQQEWREMWDLVEKIGYVTYTRRAYHQFEATENVVLDRSKLSFLDTARHTMREWALRPTLQRRFKLVSQPFVSKEERERTIVGKKSHTFSLKGSEFTTLSLPRLQLRAIALMELTEREGCARECEELLRLLGAMELEDNS